MHLLWLCSLFVPWIWGAGLLLLPRRRDGWAAGLALAGALLSAAAATTDILLRPPTGRLEELVRLAWLPELGLAFVIVRDGLSVLFAAVVLWVAVLVTLYAGKYLPHANHHEKAGRSQAVFYAWMSFFSGAMLGLLASGNLLQTYFFWELTSLASFLLIGYWNHQAEARKGARLALGMTVAGGLCMLIGFFWMGVGSGQWDWSGLTAASGQWGASLQLEACAVLILVGALAKSAQFPFSAWLPAAMSAPTPVSSFLHSAALPAAGVFLLARMHPLLHATQSWQWMLIACGGLTALYAGLLAFRQERMKAMLAFSTIAHFALMFIAFGIGTPEAVKAALYAFFVHAFIKAGLFLSAGAATHVTGRKRLDAIGGLWRPFRLFGAASLVLALALAGAPALGAFYYEEAYLKAAEHSGRSGIYAIVLTAGVFSVLYMLRWLTEIFAGARKPVQLAAPLPASMLLPCSLIAAGLLWTALKPDWMGAWLVMPAASAVLGDAHGHLEVGLEISPIFWSSMGKLLAGAALWAAWRASARLRRAWRRLPSAFSLGGRQAVNLYSYFSEKCLALHTGDIQFYLRITFSSAVGLAALVWIFFAGGSFAPVEPVDLPLSATLAAMVATAGATLFTRSPMVFVLLLTMSGFAMAAAFVLMAAPDIALAQVLVETLIDLSIILALRETLRFDPNRSRFARDTGSRPLRWFLALSIGAMVAVGTYWAAQGYPADAVGQWYAGPGFEKTGHADFVAGIVSDFRALDTVIEIMVFTAGMFAVLGLFWHEKIAEEQADE